MADKYLNETGLTYYHNRVKNAFENKIEKIKVNGTEETITNKEVDLEVPTVVTSAGRDETDSIVSILNNTANDQSGVEFSAGDDTVGFTLKNKAGTQTQNKVLATTDYVDENGGKIDVIKLNSSALPITNKEVNIDLSTYALKTELPTNVSDLTNDSGYQNESEVQALIDDALADITGMDFVLVDTLPATGEKGIIYLVPNGSTGSNVKDEYIWLTPTGETPYFEKIGSTSVDLSGYWSKTELVAITTAEIDAIVEA